MLKGLSARPVAPLIPRQITATGRQAYTQIHQFHFHLQTVAETLPVGRVEIALGLRNVTKWHVQSKTLAAITQIQVKCRSDVGRHYTLGLEFGLPSCFQAPEAFPELHIVLLG
jgi:hypothetical protein